MERGTVSRADLESQIASTCKALGDPLRRRLYLYVIAQPGPVGRDEAAQAVGVDRALAAFHLDKLAGEGLLEVSFKRLGTKTGRGAGRPSKLYRRSGRQLSFTIPERRYELAGELLARALSEADDRPGGARAALGRAARELGESIAQETRRRAGPRPSRAALLAAALSVLEEHGFEPRRQGDDVVLANCPFRLLADAHPDVVCSMNLELQRGVLAALPALRREAQLERERDLCCVKLQAG